ncbi:MAG: glycosyltransferase family 9 protein [Capsulimonadales bacterium]|nr:glycosyltransferase family 9 protein [Capsulimonadales bacterium]
MSRKIERVLAIRFGGMGDILMTTPSLRAVAETFGTDRIDFIVGRGNRDALVGLPYIREVIEFGPRGQDVQFRQFALFLRRLREGRYDLFLNFQPSLKTLTMQSAVAAPHNYIFRKDRRRRKDGRVRHAIDDFAKDLSFLGIRALPGRRMDFFIPEAAFAYVRELLHAEGIGHETTLILVNPGGTREINRWPPPKYVELLNRLASLYPKAHFLLTGGPDDVERARQIEESVESGTGDRLHNMARRLSIKETGALLARSAVFVTVDTGPMHVASALGVPMVVLSGAADPERTGPLNTDDLIVIRRDLDCVPCGDRSCRRGDIACMNGMETDWVLAAVRQRLRESLGEKQILPMADPSLPIERVTPDGLSRP